MSQLPTPLLVGAAISALIAISLIVGTLRVVLRDRRGPHCPLCGTSLDVPVGSLGCGKCQAEQAAALTRELS